MCPRPKVEDYDSEAEDEDYKAAGKVRTVLGSTHRLTRFRSSCSSRYAPSSPSSSARRTAVHDTSQTIGHGQSNKGDERVMSVRLNAPFRSVFVQFGNDYSASSGRVGRP
jgi:hypothetical protein